MYGYDHPVPLNRRGGGDHIHTHSVLLWEREGGRVTMVRYHLPLPTQWMDGGGGGLAHLPSFLFSDREGLEISSIHTPSSSEKGNCCVNGQVSCSLLTKGIGGSGHGHIPHLPLRGKGSGGGDPFLFWNREWL